MAVRFNIIQACSQITDINMCMGISSTVLNDYIACEVNNLNGT